MIDMRQDLEGHYHVQRSKIVDSPAHAAPVLMTQYGWAKRGQATTWYKTKLEPIESKLKDKNTWEP